MASAPSLVLFLFLSLALNLARPQLCDRNPLANNGVSITPQASSSCLKGRTADMTDIAACQDNSSHDIQLPFAFKYLNRTYAAGGGSVFVGSNSYVTFGASSSASSGLGPLMPAIPTIFIGSRDITLRVLSAGPDAVGWRVRYEGVSPSSAFSVQHCSAALLPTIVWELTFTRDGMLHLCTGTVSEPAAGVSGLSDGASSAFLQKFALAPATLYVMRSGLPPCSCRSDASGSNGIRITTQPSLSCMKGRTPDMTDVRSCRRAGDTNSRFSHWHLFTILTIQLLQAPPAFRCRFRSPFSVAPTAAAATTCMSATLPSSRSAAASTPTFLPSAPISHRYLPSSSAPAKTC
jgi:hypothetical protein